MHKTGFLIDDSLADAHRSIYKSVNFGVSRAAKTWPVLREITLAGIRGLFQAEELDHLINIRRGKKFEPAYAIMIESYEMLLKQRPFTEELNIKLKALECSQLLFLTDWIDCYTRAEIKDPERLTGMRKELLCIENQA